MPQKLLVTGASGLLGGRLCLALQHTHVVTAVSHQNSTGLELESRRCDLRDPGALDCLLEDCRPDCVIHCAAEARPLVFAEDPKAAALLNVEAPAQIARWCRKRDRRLIHFSSDTVYSGRGPLRHEGGSTDPENAYGQSKLASEKAVMRVLPEADIFRMSLLYGKAVRQGNSFSGWLLDRVEAGGPVPVFSDNRRNLLAVGQVTGIVQRVLDSPIGGITNLGGRDYLSREEFARRLFQQLGLDPELLEVVSQQELKLPVALPLDLEMSLGKLEAWLGEPAPGVAAGLKIEYSLCDD